MTAPAVPVDRLVNLACQIQQIPAPTFHEKARASFLYQCFQNEPLVKQLEFDNAGSVLACIPGSANAAPLVVSAHLDTVFPLETSLAILRTKDKIQAPGIGDNSLGVAALLGLVWMFSENRIQLPGDLWLVGDVCEEGLGNLRGMRAIVDRFEARPAAYLVLEGMGLGEIFHRGLGVKRFRVMVHTGGGHSWIDAGQPSALHEAARLITTLTVLSLPRCPRTTLNVGVISGGTSVNTIAPSTWFDLDLRCEDPAGLELLWRQVERHIASAQKSGVQVSWEGIGTRPAGGIPADHPLVAAALACLEKYRVEAHPGIGSTDANLPLSRAYPAISFGITRGSGAHSTAEMIETRPISQGMAALYDLILRISRF